MLNTMDKLTLEILHNHSELSSILDHPTSGSHLKNADFHQLAIFTNIMIPQRVQLTSTTELTSILPMDLEQYPDSLDKIQLGLLVLKPKIHFLLKLLNSTVSASWPLNLTEFSVWLGHQFQSMDFPWSLTFFTSKN